MTLKNDNGVLIGVSRPKGQDHRKKYSIRQMASFREKILVRDQHRCQFCGVKHQGLHLEPLDNNPFNLSERNIKSACLLCHLCLNAGMQDSKPKGRWIYLPQLTQAELNWMSYALGVGKNEFSGKLSVNASHTYKALMGLSDTLDTHYGKGASSPIALHGLLSQLPDKNYERRTALFSGFRFLPDLNHQLASKAKAWHQEIFNGIGRFDIEAVYSKWVST